MTGGCRNGRRWLAKRKQHMNRRWQSGGVSLLPNSPGSFVEYVLVFHFVVRQNRSSANDFAYSYLFLCSTVCLSVVCHIRAACLNRSTELDAIWQVHLQDPMTHCVRWWSLILMGRGDMGSIPSHNMQIAAKPAVLRCHLANTNGQLCGQRFRLSPNYVGACLWL